MPTHYALAYLAILTIPLLVGVAVYRTSRRNRSPVWTSLAATALAVGLCLVVTAAGAARCADSYAARLAAARLLSPQETSTLRGNEFVCPVLYHFERDGKTTCLRPSDGAASIGCD